MKGLFRVVTPKDIPVPPDKVPGDRRDAGYNIGDLLNMPSLMGIWNQNPHHTDELLYRMYLVGSFFKNSILNKYCAQRDNDEEIVPNIPRIRESVMEYVEENKSKLKDALDMVQHETTLCVHVRNGDLETETEYIELIKKLSKSYETVILLSGIHRDIHLKKSNEKIDNFVQTMNNILCLNSNIYLCLEEPDDHLALMMNASNLLLHKGGFSCLGSIVCHGNVFITSLFEYSTHLLWQTMVGSKFTELSFSS